MPHCIGLYTTFCQRQVPYYRQDRPAWISAGLGSILQVKVRLSSFLKTVLHSISAFRGRCALLNCRTIRCYPGDSGCALLDIRSICEWPDECSFQDSSTTTGIPYAEPQDMRLSKRLALLHDASGLLGLCCLEAKCMSHYRDLHCTTLTNLQLAIRTRRSCTRRGWF